MQEVLREWLEGYVEGTLPLDSLKDRWLAMVDLVDPTDESTLTLGNLVFALLIAHERAVIHEPLLKQVLAGL